MGSLAGLVLTALLACRAVCASSLDRWSLLEQHAVKQPALTEDERELLFQDALESIKLSTSWKEQQGITFGLLVPASGLRATQHTSTPAGLPTYLKSDGVGGQPVPGYPTLEVGPISHKGALRELAKASMDGAGCNTDPRLALELFKLASDRGDPEAQGQMAIRYALGLQHPEAWDHYGIARFLEPDEDAAMLHYYFAAKGHDVPALMALGYRHHLGQGVPKSCWTAAAYYLPVAEQIADMAANASGPGLPQVERIRLSVQAMRGAKLDRQREVMQYYQDSADKGNVDAQTAVGQVLNYGTHGVERDHEAAAAYLARAAEAGDVQAMSHLGHMHANGQGTPVDFEAALQHFQAAARQGSASAQYGLGYMHLVGQGVAQDHEQALKLMTQAAEQGHSDAHFFLGVMHLKGLGVRRKSWQRAFSYFTLAGHAGHVQAMYNAATMHLGGKGTIKSCKPAVALLKLSAERGPGATSLQQGHEAYFKGAYTAALWYYLQAAEVGMELGMSNAAWLLSRGYVRAEGRSENVTFTLHQRSSAQGNVASMLAMGDAYFYGEGVEQDWTRAASMYYEAYQERSPEAMFNVGFMHEFGAGVPQDLSLATRFYDMALHTNKEAGLAVHCARTWLSLHKAWARIEPLLPNAYAHVWDGLWSLRPPHTSILGSWTALIARAMPSRALMRVELYAWSWLQAAGVMQLFAYILDTVDQESAVLAVCLAALALVLRERQRRAGQRQQQQQDQQQGQEQDTLQEQQQDTQPAQPAQPLPQPLASASSPAASSQAAEVLPDPVATGLGMQGHEDGPEPCWLDGPQHLPNPNMAAAAAAARWEAQHANHGGSAAGARPPASADTSAGNQASSAVET